MSTAGLAMAAADVTISRKAQPAASKSSRIKAPGTSPSQKYQPKASRKAAPKAKATRRPDPTVKSKPAPKQDVRNWTACFVYASATGTANIAIRRIRARGQEKAREIALKAPPGKEFMLTIAPESHEQFLGQVRLKALSSAKNRA